MWIIKQNQWYVVAVIDGGTPMVYWDSSRDSVKLFETKQEAKDFMDKYSITGSIIPL